MAVKSKREGDRLVLELDNGDLAKLDECMAKWPFRDHQSLLRFVISQLLVTEDHALWIKEGGRQQPIAPASELLRTRGEG